LQYSEQKATAAAMGYSAWRGWAVSPNSWDRAVFDGWASRAFVAAIA